MGAMIDPPKFCGWIDHPDRTEEVREASEACIAAMPKFFLFNQTVKTEGKRMCLWEIAKKVNGGKHIPTLNQKTGSCVGNGAWNAIMYLMCIEIARGDREELQTVFLPYHYGRGRMRAGIRGRGEGSTGSGQAEAVREDGILTQQTDGLPAPSGDPDALTWGANVEMDWSDGAKIDDRFVNLAKVHPVKSTAPVKTYAQVRDAIVNGYPVTVASNRGFTMRPKENRGKMWGVPSGTWNHQMSFLGVDDSSDRPGCYCMNSWSADAHGKPAGDEPPGGFWVDADTVESMVAQGDSFAYSQFDGFPQQELDFHVI